MITDSVPESANCIANRLAQVLDEKDAPVIAQLKRIARAKGAEQCDEYVRLAVEAHKAGTCLRKDGQPRTLGGCFFRLVFLAMPRWQRFKIYYSWKREPVIQEQTTKEWSGKMSVGKLEVTVKINEIPEGMVPVKGNLCSFYLDCDKRKITVVLKQKQWDKLQASAKEFAQWVCAITGKVGDLSSDGFELIDCNLQVFERKPKATTESALKQAVP